MTGVIQYVRRSTYYSYYSRDTHCTTAAITPAKHNKGKSKQKETQRNSTKKHAHL